MKKLGRPLTGAQPLTPAERKTRQRERERAEGIVEVLVKVPRDGVRTLRDCVAKINNAGGIDT